MDGEEAKADAMDGGMEVAMEEAMEAAAMEGEMDAAMEMDPGGMDAMEAEAQPEAAATGEAEAAPVDTKLQFADDERMKKMIEWISECLENFKEDEQWTADHYGWLDEFLKDLDAKVIFFWNDFVDMSLRVSTVGPPQFYDQKPPINPQDYQVAYFMKTR